MTFTNEQYETYRTAVKGQRLPLAFVDLDAFDANVAYGASLVRGSGRTIRLGTKSIRCEPLMKRILASDEIYHGFLTFTAEETAFLTDKGHDDFILAYPTVQPSDMEILSQLTAQGKRVATMVDSLDQLQALSVAGEKTGVVMSACLEVDLAYRPLGTDAVHLGLRRSPIRTPGQALELVKAAAGLKGVRVNSVMGYEGHIAGISDAVPGARLKNAFTRLLKNASVRELTKRRQAVVGVLKSAGIRLEIVNGGGSGSVRSTLKDLSVTEITIGSGFYDSLLFHHFAEVKYQPAAFYALQVVRVPKPGMVTCMGGGYPASGPTEASKSPRPVLPPGLTLLPLEGAGEVQTPLVLPQDCPQLRPGDPVIFQHAKAGELCERFNDLILLKGGKIVDTVPTYRGEGKCFL
jgi:D-serine deaminase-like pyridoxal phosphate-dependent protein